MRREISLAMVDLRASSGSFFSFKFLYLSHLIQAFIL